MPRMTGRSLYDEATLGIFFTSFAVLKKIWLLILVEHYDFLEKIRRKGKNGLVAVLKEAFIPLMPVIRFFKDSHLHNQWVCGPISLRTFCVLSSTFSKALNHIQRP